MLALSKGCGNFLPVNNTLSMKVSKCHNKFRSVETKFEIEMIKNAITKESKQSKDDKVFLVRSRAIGFNSRPSRFVIKLL